MSFTTITRMFKDELLFIFKVEAISQNLNFSEKNSSKKSKALDLAVKKGESSKKNKTMSQPMWRKESQGQFGKKYYNNLKTIFIFLSNQESIKLSNWPRDLSLPRFV